MQDFKCGVRPLVVTDKGLEKYSTLQGIQSFLPMHLYHVFPSLRIRCFKTQMHSSKFSSKSEMHSLKKSHLNPIYPDPSPRGISLNVLRHSVMFHILQIALLFILVVTTPTHSFKILKIINSMRLTFQEYFHHFWTPPPYIPKRGRDCDNILLWCHTKHLSVLWT